MIRGRYVNIDDCESGTLLTVPVSVRFYHTLRSAGWQVARLPDSGIIVPDPARFPSGLKAIASWLHAHKMLFGIYTAAHARTCQSRPGSYLYEDIDASAYCDFGIDYLKIGALSLKGVNSIFAWI
jgi:hypothetical protein